MVFQIGKATVTKSNPGERASKEVTVTGLTASGYVLITPAERDSNDRRGQMDFYAVAGTDKITIYSEELELKADTDVYYLASDGSIPTASIASGSITADKLASNAVETLKIKDANVTLGKLAAGITPSHIIKFAGTTDAANDSTGTITITVTGAAATDIATVALRASTADVYVKKAVLTTNTLTVTLSGAGGVGTQVDYMIARAAA